MRLLILCDLEGCAGVWQWPDAVRYHELPAYGVGEVNSAIDGALEGGATEVVVWDAMLTHGNDKPVHLFHKYRSHPSVSFLFGRWEFQALRAPFNAAFFVGFHPRTQQGPPKPAGPRSGRPGVLPHTMSHHFIVHINGRVVGEYGLQAGFLGACGTPVIMVTGDETSVAQMKELMPWALGVPVKRGLGPTLAVSLHPKDARQKIHRAAREAVRAFVRSDSGSGPRPLRFEEPVSIQFQEHEASPAQIFQGRDFFNAYKAFFERRS